MNILHSIISSRILLHLWQAAEETFPSKRRNSSNLQSSDFQFATPRVQTTDCDGFELSTVGITPSIIEAHLEGTTSFRLDDVYQSA